MNQMFNITIIKSSDEHNILKIKSLTKHNIVKIERKGLINYIIDYKKRYG